MKEIKGAKDNDGTIEDIRPASCVREGNPVEEGMNDGVKGRDVVVNVVVNLTTQEENAVKCLLRDSKITAAALARQLEVSSRQAQRIISSLKVKAGLKRRGADKNGEWYFE